MSENTNNGDKPKSNRFQPGNQVGKSTQFTSTNQPKNGGRKGKAISQYLKQIGEGGAIEFDFKITDGTGKEVHKKGKIEAGNHRSTEGDEVTINEVFANLMYVDAIKGDKKTRREILDRTEGRPASYLDITSGGEVLSLAPDERRNMIEKLGAKLMRKLDNPNPNQ